MADDPEFRPDLYRGTARFYDEFRVAYPGSVLDELCAGARVSGTGRLLDLACGTGQITFGLASRFAEIWAVDQEAEAIELARAKARRVGLGHIRWITGRAEDVEADATFELVAIGNAFHRLPRRRVAECARGWLAPGGHLALLWSNPPWDGTHDWQRVLDETMRRWMEELGSTGRVPPGLDQHLADRSHADVLAVAGFAPVDAFERAVPYEWTVERLTGFVFSTSVLSQPVLGAHVEAFVGDLRRRLLAVEPDDRFREDISFGCTLGHNP